MYADGNSGIFLFGVRRRHENTGIAFEEVGEDIPCGKFYDACNC